MCTTRDNPPGCKIIRSWAHTADTEITLGRDGNNKYRGTLRLCYRGTHAASRIGSAAISEICNQLGHLSRAVVAKLVSRARRCLPLRQLPGKLLRCHIQQGSQVSAAAGTREAAEFHKHVRSQVYPAAGLQNLQTTRAYGKGDVPSTICWVRHLKLSELSLQLPSARLEEMALISCLVRAAQESSLCAEPMAVTDCQRRHIGRSLHHPEALVPRHDIGILARLAASHQTNAISLS